MDKLDGRVEEFFKQCKRQKATADWKTENFENIKKVSGLELFLYFFIKLFSS